MSRPRSSLLGRILLASTSVLIGLAVLDVGYRFLVEPEDVVPTSIGQFDSELGWSLEPNSSGHSSRTGSRITYRINSKGLRDDEHEYRKPEGTFRIVLLGDSRTFGYGVPADKHFARLLEGYFERLEVINMGVSGYGVDQELLLLRSEGFRYEPDLVMAYVAHFGNHRHMHAERWGKQKPKFQLQGSNLVLTNSPVDTIYAHLDLAHKIDLFLTLHSPAYRDLSRLVVGIVKGGSTGAPVDATRTPDQRDVEDPTFVDRMYEVAEAILHRMDEEARTRGARFVLLTEIERLHRECTERGIVSLDVATPLQNSLFPLPDGLEHINESGNGVLAWEIATFLRESGIVPAGHWKTGRRRVDTY